MKKELSPAITWTAIIVVVLVAVLVGYKYLAPKPPDSDKKGQDAVMKRIQAGGKLYEPPAGAPVPGAAGSGPTPMMPRGGGTTAPPTMGGPGGGGMTMPSPPR